MLTMTEGRTGEVDIGNEDNDILKTLRPNKWPRIIIIAPR
jgi:hypothetical protein